MKVYIRLFVVVCFLVIIWILFLALESIYRRSTSWVRFFIPTYVHIKSTSGWGYNGWQTLNEFIGLESFVLGQTGLGLSCFFDALRFVTGKPSFQVICWICFTEICGILEQLVFFSLLTNGKSSYHISFGFCSMSSAFYLGRFVKSTSKRLTSRLNKSIRTCVLRALFSSKCRFWVRSTTRCHLRSNKMV